MSCGATLDLVYHLAVPMTVLPSATERRAIIAALDDAPCDAIWLKVENFGDNATGEKLAAYIDACRDFHERGVPLVGDHIGGLPWLRGAGNHERVGKGCGRRETLMREREERP
ncbi:MAG: hypothetical protein JNM75_14365 [Rhodospirillales bacterium]|nr:hypothetical protein [Rhodospirillales bacterium]